MELLAVLFIMCVMLGLLLPALQSARHSVQATSCQNNVRQLEMGLGGYIHAMRRFPDPNRWTVATLRWTEEYALADAMKNNNDANAKFPRPPLMRCPMQEDYSSRVPNVGFAHYVLAVDRPILGSPEKIHWEIHDRELLADGVPQEPWYLAPEISFFGQQTLFASKPGPHPPGLFMTSSGLVPR